MAENTTEYHITTNGQDRLCGATEGPAIHVHYAHIPTLDEGKWCEKCQAERKRQIAAYLKDSSFELFPNLQLSRTPSYLDWLAGKSY